MEAFRENVIWLADMGNHEFPVRFNNEIYYSEQYSSDRFHAVSYTSNFSIKYVFQGEETYVVNGRKEVVNDGKMLVVNDKSTVVNLSATGNAFSIFLNPSILSECHQELVQGVDSCLEYPLNDKNLEMQFFDSVLNQQAPFLELLRSRLKHNPKIIIPIDFYYELAESLLLTQNKLYKHINSIGSVKLSTRKEIFRRLNLAKAFLDDSIKNSFDLDQLSHECGLSKYHLIRHFKSAFKLTPHRYFIVKKLKKAKQRICESKDLMLTDIAFEFGYPDLFSFSKQFKQIHGHSPSKLKG